VVDVEIIGQTEIVKKITNKQIRNSSRTNAAVAGLAKYSQKNKISYNMCLNHTLCCQHAILSI